MALVLERPIPLPVGLSKGPAEAQPEQLGSALNDVFYTTDRTWRRRPGRTLFCDLGVVRGIQGLYAWHAQNVVVAVCDGVVYHIDRTGVATEIAGAKLGTVQRVSFPKIAGAGDLPMANGGKIVIDDGAACTAIADADAPIAVDTLDWHDTYLLGQVAGGELWQYSAVNDDTAWDALDFENAQTIPDKLLALHAAYRHIFLFGEESMEVWWNDSETPWSRNDQAYKQIGLMARDAVAFVSSPVDAFVWMDDKRNIQRLDQGRGLRSVGDPIETQLRKMSVVNDVKATVFYMGAYAFVAFGFIQENRTFVYEVNQEQWYEWGIWNSGTGRWDRFPIDTACYMKAWNMLLVGDAATGKIYHMNFDKRTDNGTEIRSRILGAHVTHGNYQIKVDHALVARVLRGQGGGANEPQMQLRYQDQNGPWSNEIDLSLGAIGDGDFLVKVEGLGAYQTRRYEFIHSDPSSDFELIAVHVFVEGAEREPGEQGARW